MVGLTRDINVICVLILLIVCGNLNKYWHHYKFVGTSFCDQLNKVWFFLVISCNVTSWRCCIMLLLIDFIELEMVPQKRGHFSRWVSLTEPPGSGSLSSSHTFFVDSTVVIWFPCLFFHFLTRFLVSLEAFRNWITERWMHILAVGFIPESSIEVTVHE